MGVGRVILTVRLLVELLFTVERSIVPDKPLFKLLVTELNVLLRTELLENGVIEFDLVDVARVLEVATALLVCITLSDELRSI